MVEEIKKSKGGPQSESPPNTFRSNMVVVPGNSGQSATMIVKPGLKRQPVDQRNITGLARGDFSPMGNEPFVPDVKPPTPQIRSSEKVDAPGSGD
jgi:hypothetical protein